MSLDAHLALTLRNWRKTQMVERLAWGAAYEDTVGLLFTWEHGRPALPDYVSKTFVKTQARRSPLADNP